MIADLCARDWGLYTTVSQNLDKLLKILKENPNGLPVDEEKLITGRVNSLKEIITTAPKTQAWKMRAVVGKRMRWYEEVEEVIR